MPPKKKQLVNRFSTALQPWEGLITSQDPYSISEKACVWIEGLPKLTGAIETPPASSQVLSLSSIKYYFNAYINGIYHVVLTGSNIVFYNSNFNQVASTSMTDEICDWCVQDNQYLWVVTRNKLIAFNGTTIYDLSSANVFGDTICYWKGRVFIAKDRTITYTVPNPNPSGSVSAIFNTSQGAGYIMPSAGEYSKIYALVPKEDTIFIFTNMNIMGLIGTTISNDPTQWYIAELSSGVGITGIRKYAVIEHTIYFHSQMGMYGIIATLAQKIDDAITNVTQNVKAVGFFQYNQQPYLAVIAPKHIGEGYAMYCYNVLLKKWYALNIDAISICTCDNVTTYYTIGNKIYKLFGSNNSYLPLKVVSKRFFNAEGVYYNIRSLFLYGRGSDRYEVKGALNMQRNYNVKGYRGLIFMGENQFIFGSGGSGMILQQRDFFNLVFYPLNDPFSKRFDEFDFTIEQQTTDYSELILVKFTGT
ncbi:MAG: hypothetical protein RMI01_08765, partial [Thermodesulfovibrio sp.]|nr:hypothetical protein [Thermodesulfovibrio sp.]